VSYAVNLSLKVAKSSNRSWNFVVGPSTLGSDGISDGSGSKIFDPGQVGSIFCGSGRVGSAIHGLGLNFGKFPLKMSKKFNFFTLGQEKSLWVGSESTRIEGGSASYLLRVKSKLGSGRVKAHI